MAALGNWYINKQQEKEKFGSKGDRKFYGQVTKEMQIVHNQVKKKLRVNNTIQMEETLKFYFNYFVFIVVV